MPKSKIAISKQSFNTIRVKHKIGTRSSTQGALQLSTQALLDIVNGNGRKRDKSKAMKVLHMRNASPT